MKGKMHPPMRLPFFYVAIICYDTMPISYTESITAAFYIFFTFAPTFLMWFYRKKSCNEMLNNSIVDVFVLLIVYIVRFLNFGSYNG